MFSSLLLLTAGVWFLFICIILQKRAAVGCLNRATVELILVLIGTIVIVLGFLFSFFGITSQTFGQYTSIVTPTDSAIIRVASSIVGCSMMVAGWRIVFGDKDQTLLMEFGRKMGKTKRRFWVEEAIGEGFGITILWAYFALAQSHFFYLPGFPITTFQTAITVMQLTGSLLVAQSTLDIVAEAKARLSKS